MRNDLDHADGCISQGDRMQFLSDSWLSNPVNRVFIDPDNATFSRRAAWLLVVALKDVLLSQDYAVFVPSAGRTPIPVYRYMVKHFRHVIDWRRVIVVQMDEYCGRSYRDKESMSAFIEAALIEPLGVTNYVSFFDYDGRPKRSLVEYEQYIAKLGGIDVVCHGIGTNGHIGFNEPGTPWDSPTRTVQLAQSTIKANFDDATINAGNAAANGVTLGLSVLSSARHAFLLLAGTGKDHAVRRLFEDPPSTDLPASSLSRNERVTIICDASTVGVQYERRSHSAGKIVVDDLRAQPTAAEVESALHANERVHRLSVSPHIASFVAAAIVEVAVPNMNPGQLICELQTKDYRDIIGIWSPRSHARTAQARRNVDPVVNAADLLPCLDINNSLRVYFHNHCVLPSILELLSKCSPSTDDLFDQLHDMAGNYRFVRRGIVKCALLADGTSIIAKRANPAKPRRFQNEVDSIATLNALGLCATGQEISALGCRIRLRLLDYLAFACDPIAQRSRSLMISVRIDLPTLEDLLKGTRDGHFRRKLLSGVATLLEFLYSKGVLWGDFAPRNILVDVESDPYEFVILDFEKTTFVSGPVSFEARCHHARGPMCVEEFGAICSRDEVETCFAPYFRPSEWDTGSNDPIAIPQPKPDYLSILSRRGNDCPTQGQYDALELAIMDVRFPFDDPVAGVTRFPLHIGFRVDHYFGFSADRDVTEVLLFAKSIMCFPLTTAVLLQLLDQVDEDLASDELLSIVDGRDPERDVARLRSGRRFMHWLHSLHIAIDSAEKFRATLEESLRAIE